MTMESFSASAPGTVAMEMLPVLEEDEGSPASAERQRPRGAFSRGRFSLLVVIGDIGSEPQLDAARLLIERGERVRRCAGVTQDAAAAALQQRGVASSAAAPGRALSGSAMADTSRKVRPEKFRLSAARPQMGVHARLRPCGPATLLSVFSAS